ncbi:MAG: phage capsid protein [bacterium]
MGTLNPSLDQATLLTFEKNFYKLAQQKDTKLLNTPAIKFMDIKGISNVSRMGTVDLVEVTGQKNPEKQYTQMTNDNRKSKARRFTRTFLFDNYDKAINFITDPTSDLFEQLNNAKKRTTDKVIVEAAVGNVIIGGPESAGTSITAAADGVLTITGTSNFNYTSVIVPAIRNYINGDVDTTGGLTFALTGSEHESFMNDDKYINSLYSKANPVDNGEIKNASGLQLVKFAGTDNGVITVPNPILPEAGGVRSNVILSPNSIGFAMEVGKLSCDPSAKHVNSWEVTIDVYFKAVRLEGKLVQIVTSTI